MTDFVRDWYMHGWGTGDEEVLRRHMHDEFVDVWHEVDAEGLVAVVRDLHRTFPDLILEVIDMAGAADRVTTVWLMRGTDDGGMFAMPPTGRSVAIKAICLDDLMDGKVARHQQVSDMWRLARQLEVIPGDWQGDRPLQLPTQP